MDINEIKIKRAFKKIDFIKTELEYTKKLLEKYDKDFIENVNIYLNNNPVLKEQYENTKKIEEGKILNFIQKEKKAKCVEDFVEEVELEKKETSIKLKTIYRKIAKLTHPDKTNDVELNNIYVKATNYYDDSDIFSLYELCIYLKIDFDVDEEDLSEFERKVTGYEGNIKFMESTYTWLWANSEEEDRDKIIYEFLILKINT